MQPTTCSIQARTAVNTHRPHRLAAIRAGSLHLLQPRKMGYIMDDAQVEQLTLTKDQAAHALNVPEATVLNLARTGQLASVMVGKHKRWLWDDLRDYVQGQRESGACVQKAR